MVHKLAKRIEAFGETWPIVLLNVGYMAFILVNNVVYEHNNSGDMQSECRPIAFQGHYNTTAFFFTES